MVIVITSGFVGFTWVYFMWLANVTVRLQLSTQWLVKNKAVSAPIKFEEIVMVKTESYRNTEEKM